MGIQERKDREREQRKTNIIDCAMKVFLEKGIVNSSMEEIAECAELGKATLYLYFKSKEELVLNVLNNVLGNFNRYIEDRVSKVESAVDKIRMNGEALLDFYQDCHGQYVLLNNKESMSGMDFSSQDIYHDYVGQHRKFWALIRNPINQAIEEGFFRKDANAVEISITLWSTSIGLMHEMDNVMATINCPDFQKITEKSESQKQLQTLDYKKMLRNLWEAIITSYHNK
jgi:TetR/AcrR family transcriptional regulator